MELAIMVVLLLSDTGVWYNGRGGNAYFKCRSRQECWVCTLQIVSLVNWCFNALVHWCISALILYIVY